MNRFIVNKFFYIICVWLLFFVTACRSKTSTGTVSKKTEGMQGMNMAMKENDTATISDTQLNFLLKPTNEYVLSSVPVTTISTANESH